MITIIIVTIVILFLLYNKNNKSNLIGTKNGLHASDIEKIRRFAPLLVFSKNEKFYPSTINYILENTSPLQTDLNGEYSKPGYTAITRKPYETVTPYLDFFYGFDGKNDRPDLDKVQIYAMVFPKVNKEGTRVSSSIPEDLSCTPSSPILENTDFSIGYFVYYPYNYGKKIPLLFGQVMGNHVSDIESYFIDFEKGNPKNITIAFHEWDIVLAWDKNTDVTESGKHNKNAIKTDEFKKSNDEGKEDKNGTHPILYVAEGSHGMNHLKGRKYYIPAIGLNDYYPGDGKQLQTWKKNRCIPVTYLDWIQDLERLGLLKDGDNTWRSKDIHLYNIRRWGNRKYGCNITGECIVNDGPSNVLAASNVLGENYRNLKNYVNTHYNHFDSSIVECPSS